MCQGKVRRRGPWVHRVARILCICWDTNRGVAMSIGIGVTCKSRHTLQ